MEELRISDEYELQALHRAIFEAKFSVNAEDQDVAGSPLVSDIANRILEILESHDARWSDWRKIKNHPKRVEASIHLMKQWHHWDKLSNVERLQAARVFLAPLTCSDDEVAEIIKAVDS